MWASIPSRRAISASFVNGFPSSLRFWEVAHRLVERMYRIAVAINQPTPYLPQCYLFDSDMVLFSSMARVPLLRFEFMFPTGNQQKTHEKDFLVRRRLSL